jgi:hypothetical protein
VEVTGVEGVPIVWRIDIPPAITIHFREKEFFFMKGEKEREEMLPAGSMDAITVLPLERYVTLRYVEGRVSPYCFFFF